MIIVKKDEFDQWFEQAFDEAAKHHSVTPDPTASWNRLEQQLAKRKNRFHRLRIFSLVAASFLLGAVIFGSPTVTQAVTPFFASIKNLDQDMISFIFGSKERGAVEAKTSAPIEEIVEEIVEENPTNIGADVPGDTPKEEVLHAWEDMKGRLAFNPIRVDYVPEDYKLSEIRIYAPDQHSLANEAMAVYFNSDKQRLIIKFTKLTGNEVLTSPHYKEGGTFEEIQVHNLNAYLFINKNKKASLEYMDAGVHISINGELEKDEIIKLAEHIK